MLVLFLVGITSKFSNMQQMQYEQSIYKHYDQSEKGKNNNLEKKTEKKNSI